MKYDPKIPLKYYRDERYNILLNRREWRWFWFKIYPLVVLGSIGLMSLILYFALDFIDWIKLLKGNP